MTTDVPAKKMARCLQRLREIGDQQVLDLPRIGSWPATRHRFRKQDLSALRAAMAAERPLLIRGEPGIGKSQLARAAAHVLKWPFLSQVINARCECSDLLYDYDAVSRLAQAQILRPTDSEQNWHDKLRQSHFVRPGILWRAFNWPSALKQSQEYYAKAHDSCPARQPAAVSPPTPPGWEPGDGCVVLIDEIDKADTDVPNGLLEALGNLGFDVPYTGESVAQPEGDMPPLVVVTTNQERELPMAFLRRCLVYPMKLEDEDGGPQEFLVKRGRDHFDDRIAKTIYQSAAEQLLQQRKQLSEPGQLKPGVAEYLDLLRALTQLCEAEDERQQKDVLNEIKKLAFDKNSRELGW